MSRIRRLLFAFIGCITLTQPVWAIQQPWNMPYPDKEATANILYSGFSQTPKHFDPARSYSEDEYGFIMQIYEPPLQYRLQTEPYELEPLTAAKMPTIEYVDAQLQETSDTSKVVYTIYTIDIQPGIYYQPHPALTGKRELIADDYVYQIKRLAHPALSSPILGLMGNYIVGLDDFSKTLNHQYESQNKAFLNLNQFELKGATVLSRYQYQMMIKGKEPHFIYWLAMPFFAPVPPEADVYYAQDHRAEQNISLDTGPIGTGPYYLSVFHPQRDIQLKRNPNFHEEYFPGKPHTEEYRLPFIDEIHFSLEKESIPLWIKFLQGYYDFSGISSDNFDQVVQFSDVGLMGLSEDFEQKGLYLTETTPPGIFYIGFNMIDDVVGGDTMEQRALRQAIALAIDIEEYILIFLNGRGLPAQSPIPPGLFGYDDGETGINPVVYQWENNHAERRSISEAKVLLAKAGYPNGRDKKTGMPLTLHFDTVSSGGGDDKAFYTWLTEQFEKLDITLDVRATDYNRFQDKMSKGNTQIYFWGWNADYPDPENFFLCLYGPNSMIKSNGENTSNYNNPQFNELYLKMRSMDSTPERLKVIQSMNHLLQQDTPWVFGFYPKDLTLSQQWNNVLPVNAMINNGLKYRAIDPVLRAKLRTQWNQPILSPLWWVLLLTIISLLPAGVTYWHKQHKPAKRSSSSPL